MRITESHGRRVGKFKIQKRWFPRIERQIDRQIAISWYSDDAPSRVFNSRHIPRMGRILIFNAAVIRFLCNAPLPTAFLGELPLRALARYYRAKLQLDFATHEGIYKPRSRTPYSCLLRLGVSPILSFRRYLLVDAYSREARRAPDLLIFHIDIIESDEET